MGEVVKLTTKTGGESSIGVEASAGNVQLVARRVLAGGTMQSEAFIVFTPAQARVIAAAMIEAADAGDPKGGQQPP